jgi:hypothetical protein
MSEQIKKPHEFQFKQQKSISIYWSPGLLYMTKAHAGRLRGADGEIAKGDELLEMLLLVT